MANRNPAARIDALMRAYQGEVPGASVLVVDDGRPQFRSYGFADLEQRRAASGATNYRLASLSKQFTAAIILLLVQDGLLALDAALRGWLPSLPPALDPVTVRQLLTHTSGLVDYEDLIPATRGAPLRDRDVLELLSTENRTYFEPGSSYRYSNSGYALRALIAARPCGGNFASLLQTRIFTPLGMRHSVAHEEGVSSVAQRAYGYSERHGQWRRTDQSLTSAVLGDGGIYSSIEDLEKWDAALYDGRLLTPQSLRLAFQSATRTDDPSVDYGFGWRITGDSVWHSGESIGFRNVLVRFPARRLTVAVLTNRDDPPPYPAALAIARIVRAQSSLEDWAPPP
jgi:CubicO group peptidase (beta-lactamase class C family)